MMGAVSIRTLCLAALTTLAACGGGGSALTGGTGGVTTPTPTPGPTPTPASGTDVVTYKYDTFRSGANLTETVLTPANVNSGSFGRLRFLATDAKVDAQPLYLSGLSLMGGTHNVVYVASEGDTVYAFDADSGAVLWQVSLLGSNETVDDLPPYGCDQVSPTIGVTSTPVIDRSAGLIYVVAMSKTSGSSSYHQRLHALDLTSGAEKLGGPVDISASFAVAGGATTFDPAQYVERAALLLSQGTLYTSWTSHCDVAPYSGWVIAFDAQSLARTAVLDVAPNSGGAGPAIWMSGGGPAADTSGNVYLLTANGAFETSLTASGFPSGADYGNSFLKLVASGGTLQVADYFTMSNVLDESSRDVDLGSGGVLLLPDLTDASGTVRQLAVGAGKDGNIYVVERGAMGKFAAGTNQIWQQVNSVLGGGIWSTPAYFNGTLYYGPVGDALRAFAVHDALLSSTPSSTTSNSFTYPGTAPSVSASGTANAIVWAHENSDPAVLHAYDATDLSHELYNSAQAAGGRDQLGTGNKFITPVVADGKVFVGQQNGVAVFGLL
ncbi:MAG: PQQ-binding-like beta-propeller repeat protein [Gammaproteobacteria bacterium]|nr:PQQ-binding-like beta-propeller repeat protein [Gammaproteobacteria bacterium]